MFIFTYLFYLSVLSLICGTPDLRSSLWHVEILIAACGVYFPDQRSNPRSLYWKGGILVPRPSGKSLFIWFFFFLETEESKIRKKFMKQAERTTWSPASNKSSSLFILLCSGLSYVNSNLSRPEQGENGQNNYKELLGVRIRKRMIRKGRRNGKKPCLILSIWRLGRKQSASRLTTPRLIWLWGLWCSRMTWCQVGSSSVVKYVPKLQHLVIWPWRQWSGILVMVLHMNLTFPTASE